jgi:hypothetical protein
MLALRSLELFCMYSMIFTKDAFSRQEFVLGLVNSTANEPA